MNDVVKQIQSKYKNKFNYHSELFEEDNLYHNPRIVHYENNLIDIYESIDERLATKQWLRYLKNKGKKKWGRKILKKSYS